MTVAFQAKVENNSIPIPDIYRDFFVDETIVTVSFADKTEKVHKEDFISFVKLKKMPHSIGIDMSGFKFNRDELNER